MVLHRPRSGGRRLQHGGCYALNHFQYRLVREKEGDEITCHAEVEKRYDWGIPSEHRGTVSGGGPGPMGMDLEQAEIAHLHHLHSSGMAQDFDVSGSSEAGNAMPAATAVPDDVARAGVSGLW